MNKRIQTLLLILVFAICSKAQSLEQILQKHYDAVGIDHLVKIKTIQYEGYRLNHFLKKIGPDIPEKLFKPKFKILVENKKRYLNQDIGMHGEGAYGFSDGEYWKDPAGFPPEKWIPNNGDRLLIDFWKDIEGFLFNSYEKGHDLRLISSVSIENNNYYRIRLITSKKDTLYYYLNSKTYLLSKLSFGGDISTGKEFPTFTFQKYKRIEGVKFSYKIIYRLRTLDGTFDESEMIITKIIFNPKFNNNIFTLNHRIINQKESK